MASLLSCYFLDAPLDADELEFASSALIGPWSKFKLKVEGMTQKRVPFVVPAPDSNGAYRNSREQRAQRISANLQHAGIGADQGKRVAWVMPRDISWDAIFQFAIRRQTGLAPFVIQRWYLDQGELQRGQMRVVDTQMLLQEL